jgi:sugar phosphate isomerase/epimerase
MRLRLVIPLALVALTVPLAACGESEKDKYIDDFKPLNDKLLAVGQDLGTAVEGADKATDDKLATEFAGLAKRLKSVNEDIAALDTPSDLTDEARGLEKRLDATIKDIEDIAKAARENNAEAFAGAIVQLSTDSQQVNTAQNKLAKATGADVGSR